MKMVATAKMHVVIYIRDFRVRVFGIGFEKSFVAAFAVSAFAEGGRFRRGPENGKGKFDGLVPVNWNILMSYDGDKMDLGTIDVGIGTQDVEILAMRGKLVWRHTCR